ncbi:MAG TPA: hypothetical protein VEC99_15910, partial [Clostridia bacterium]|nr:hypothetical protein [Clostridia bacterium]
MDKQKWQTIAQVVAPTLAAMSFLGATVTIVSTLTFDALPPALVSGQSGPYPARPWIVGGILLLIAFLAGVWTLTVLDPLKEKSEVQKASDTLFTRYLIGIGYFLFVDAVLNMVAFAGFARSGSMERIFPLGDGALKATDVNQSVFTRILELKEALLGSGSHTDSVVLMVILFISLGMALLGALFYFANSLWEKFNNKQVFFSRNIFWGGLWFRLAEAIVLTIAVFLFLQFQGYEKAISYLPLMGLVIGMTVKSSETLVFGLIERILSAITSFVGNSASNISPETPSFV